jgi:hypothetical protein
VENCVWLSRDVQMEGAAQRATTRIMIVVGDRVRRIGDGHICRVLGGRTIRRSGDFLCCLYRAQIDEKRGFLD